MSKITDYFNEIQITALAQPSVVSVEKIRDTEDQKENIGIYRYRIYMKNGGITHLITQNLITFLTTSTTEARKMSKVIHQSMP